MSEPCQCRCRNVWLALAVVSLFGVVVTGVFVYRENQFRLAVLHAEEQAARRLAQIEKGNEIIGSTLDDVNPRAVPKTNEPLEAVLARRLAKAAAELDGEAIGDPLAVAELRKQLAISLTDLASSNLQDSQPAAAEALLRETFPSFEQADPNSLYTLQVRLLLGEALLAQQKQEEAAPLLKQCYEALQDREPVILPNGPSGIPAAIERLIKLYTALDKPDEVKKWQAEREKYPAGNGAAK